MSTLLRLINYPSNLLKKSDKSPLARSCHNSFPPSFANDRRI